MYSPKKSTSLIKIFIFSLLCSIIFSQGSKVDYLGEVDSEHIINGQEYISSDDGTLLMYVNVWGHVKHPGTYLVYDGIDYMSALSVSGGHLQGADLKNVIILGKDGSRRSIDLDLFYKNHTINH